MPNRRAACRQDNLRYAAVPESNEKEDLLAIAKPLCKGICDVQNDIKTAVQNALMGDCDVVILCGSLTLFQNLNDDKKTK